MEKLLDQIAEKLIRLDEATLIQLLPEYKRRMESFEPTAEWEKSVVIFFIINSVRVKNSLFNENVLKGKPKKKKGDKGKDSPLKLVK